MSIAELTCTCGSIGRTDLRQCPIDHHIWRGDKRLASVGSIIHASFPLDPTIPPAILENARERGSETDALLAAYCRGTLRAIPRGTRRDSEALFYKAQNWFDKQNFRTVEVQVLLGCEDHGGVLDFRFDGVPVDLKCTYNVEQTARLQVAAYRMLDSKPDGEILHVTERFKEATIVPITGDDWHDWEIMLAHWRMVQRRLK